MIKVNINKEKETVTFTTTLTVEGKTLQLSVTKYLYYQKPNQLDNPTFMDVFYWSEDCYTKKELNHNMYHRLLVTNYNNVNGRYYEVQWFLLD
jgi:hypothetical protein